MDSNASIRKLKQEFTPIHSYHSIVDLVMGSFVIILFVVFIIMFISLVLGFEVPTFIIIGLLSLIAILFSFSYYWGGPLVIFSNGIYLPRGLRKGIFIKFIDIDEIFFSFVNRTNEGIIIPNLCYIFRKNKLMNTVILFNYLTDKKAERFYQNIKTISDQNNFKVTAVDSISQRSIEILYRNMVKKNNSYKQYFTVIFPLILTVTFPIILVTIRFKYHYLLSNAEFKYAFMGLAYSILPLMVWSLISLVKFGYKNEYHHKQKCEDALRDILKLQENKDIQILSPNIQEYLQKKPKYYK